MISHPHRCIFVHIPKTGGSSVEDVIWPGPRSEAELWMGFTSRFRNRYQTGGLQHLCAHQIRTVVGADVFDSYFRFAIVRNPWDKAVSQFAWLSKRADLREYLGLPEQAGFAMYLDRITAIQHVQWMPQLDFLRAPDGTMLVDHIGRFETLETDCARIFAAIGFAGKVLPHRRASVRARDYREYYTERTRDRLAEIYAEDIATFGYTF